MNKVGKRRKHYKKSLCHIYFQKSAAAEASAWGKEINWFIFRILWSMFIWVIFFHLRWLFHGGQLFLAPIKLLKSSIFTPLWSCERQWCRCRASASRTKGPGFEYRDERVQPFVLFYTNGASTGYVSRKQTSSLIIISLKLVSKSV